MSGLAGASQSPSAGLQDGSITVYVYFKLSPGLAGSAVLEQFERLSRALREACPASARPLAEPLSHTLMQRLTQTGEPESTWMEVHSGLGSENLPGFLATLDREAERMGWAALALGGRHIEVFTESARQPDA